MSLSVESAVSTLRDLGVVIKMSKTGNVLVVDFRPVATLIEDEHVKYVKGFNRLREIHLESAAVTDASLKNLIEKDCLTTIDLQNTRVTDNGIASLLGLPALKLLLLTGSCVTGDGVKQFRKSMLKTRIVFL